MRAGLRTSACLLIGCLAVLSLARAGAACAQPLDAKDITPVRTEHKRAAADGKLPLPGTPDLARLDERLAMRGLAADSAMLIRIFKAESELEVWMSRDGGAAYTLFAAYPICYWSGTLGPKIKEGDRQAPEGFYTVTLPQAYPNGQRHPLALNIGYPNWFDQIHARNGSHILIHGGCASIGCFAMTDAVNKEIRTLTLRALDAGQAYIPVQVFPFRMTQENLARYDRPELQDFWQNLKEGYDLFERTRRPPRVSVCGSRYTFDETDLIGSVNPGPVDVCQRTKDLLQEIARINTRVAEEDTAPPPPMTKASLGSFPYRTSNLRLVNQTSSGENSLRQLAPQNLIALNPALTRPLACSVALPACRKYAVLRTRIAQAAVEAAVSEANPPPAKKARVTHHRRRASKKH